MNSIITPIIMVTKNCVLNCSYCYVESKNKDIISLELVYKILNEIIEYNKSNTTIIWHGGEPLLAGIDFFKDVIQYLNHRFPTIKISHKIQTSGLLITDDWVNFFKENDIGIGISLDAPKKFHDINRKTKTGKNSFELIENSISKLNNKDVKFGILTVITKHSINSATDIFGYFYSKKLDFGFSILTPVNQKLLNIAPSEQEYCEFYYEMLDLYLNQKEPTISVVPLMHHVMSLLLNKSVDFCANSENCANDYLSFAPNGDTFACDRFVECKDTYFGNINVQKFDEILNSKNRMKFYDRSMFMKDKCSDCKYLNICFGGCPHESYVRHNSLYENEFECNIYKKIFAFAEKRLTEFLV